MQLSSFCSITEFQCELSATLSPVIWSTGVSELERSGWYKSDTTVLSLSSLRLSALDENRSGVKRKMKEGGQRVIQDWNIPKACLQHGEIGQGDLETSLHQARTQRINPL